MKPYDDFSSFWQKLKDNLHDPDAFLIAWDSCNNANAMFSMFSYFKKQLYILDVLNDGCSRIDFGNENLCDGIRKAYPKIAELL